MPTSSKRPLVQPSPSQPCGTVARLLVDHLRAEGVSKVFGIPGGAAVWVMDELQRRASATGEIAYVICRHESGAAYMADGYARVGGGLGVVLTTSGPGATNALTGAMNAQASHSAVLVITGEVPQAYDGKGYLQEGTDARLDVHNVFLNAVGSSALVSSPLNFQTLLQQALRNALTRPRQTAHLSLPNDIAGACAPDYPARIEPRAYRPHVACADGHAMDAIIKTMASSRRPLIFLGSGARDALAEGRRLRAFSRFVERFGIPVMTTPNAKGIFPESHALSLRNYGMCGSNWPARYMHPTDGGEAFDALLVLGSSLGELSTSVHASEPYSQALEPSRHFIQVDLDASMIGRDFPITQGVVAEIAATIDSLCERSQAVTPERASVQARRKAIRAIKASMPAWSDDEGRQRERGPIHPAAMMRAIQEAVTEGHLFIDAGNCVGWSLNQLVIDPPLRYHSALAMGPMGFGVAAVIGGKMAAPGQPCVAIVGDGAFMMHGAEISTAARHRVGAIWIVLDDNDLAMVSQGMAQLLPPAAQWQTCYELGRPDLAMFAQSLGAEAVTITERQGLGRFRAALKRAMAHAQAHALPQVIVVRVDRAAAPPYGWPRLTPASCCGDSA